MIGKTEDQKKIQANIFSPLLASFINVNDPLIILGEKINWQILETEFAKFYSNTGTPAKPIRLMSGLLILKQMFNLSDERVVEVWKQNPYYQYFTGSSFFSWTQPCDASDLVHYRKRIGEEGCQQIFRLSVLLHQKKVDKATEINVDTTVQEKNITYPTDTKLAIKIIAKCKKLAKKEGLTLRQTYTKTIKTMLIKCRFAHHPKRSKEGIKARKKIKIIAGRLIRDIERKLAPIKCPSIKVDLDFYKRILAQKKSDKNKIYSVHEPSVSCIAKGKLHKPYEFGSKVSIASLAGSNVIVGIASFQGNPNDTKTIKQTLENVFLTCNKRFNDARVDRGYPGHKEIDTTKIIIPNSKKDKNLSPYQKQKKRKQCRGRAAIEPIIGHVKQDCRMLRNYLKGTSGDSINAILAVSAFNFRKFLKEIFCFIFRLTKNTIFFNFFKKLIPKNTKFLDFPEKSIIKNARC